MATESAYPRTGDRTPSACAQREEHWRRVLARQRQSGLSGAAFCRREGVKESAMSWWARELSERDQSPRKGVPRHARPKKRTSRPAFVPVHVIESTPAVSPCAIEVVTRGGHVLRLKAGFDPETLRRAVTALEAQPC